MTAVTIVSCDVHPECAVRSTALVRLLDVEPNLETATGGGRRRARLSGRALGYQRSALLMAGPSRVPDGWQETRLVSAVGHGVEVFGAAADALLDLDAHRRAGIRVAGPDPDLPEDVTLLDGPMRGPCRFVDRIDESLRQGLVLGTLDGNSAVAEHRCHLGLDPDTGAVTATVRTAWRPGSAFLLPGAGRREARAYRRMGERLLRALGACGPQGSGVAGGRGPAGGQGPVGA